MHFLSAVVWGSGHRLFAVLQWVEGVAVEQLQSVKDNVASLVATVTLYCTLKYQVLTKAKT